MSLQFRNSASSIKRPWMFDSFFKVLDDDREMEVKAVRVKERVKHEHKQT